MDTENKFHTDIKRVLFFLLILSVTLFLVIPNNTASVDSSQVKDIRNVKVGDEDYLYKSLTNFDSEIKHYREISLKEDAWYSILGFFKRTVLTKTLTYHTNECLVDCESRGTTVLYADGPLFDKLDFYNKKGKSAKIKYTIYVNTVVSYDVEVPDKYKEVCSDSETDLKIETELDSKEKPSEPTEPSCWQEVESYKTETRTRNEWVEYNFEKVKAGTYEWKIIATKKPTDQIDWVATSFNTTLSEWAWFNSSWLYKKQINITANNGNITYFVVNHSTGMNNDFGDVRFLNSAEDTELNYTIQSYSSGANATVRVQSNGASSFYMYYGNSAVNTTGNFSGLYYSPVAYYTFENDSNFANMGTYDLTIDVGTPTFKQGKVGRAVVLANTVGIGAEGSSTLLSNYATASMCGWFNSSVTDTIYRDGITKTDNHVSFNNMIRKTNANKFQNSFKTNIGDTYPDSTTTITANTYYFVCSVYNGTHLNLYVDGIMEDSHTLTGTILTRTDTFYVGYVGATDSWIGEIDEVSIWANRSLSQSQVNAIYTTEATITVGDEEEVPQVWWNTSWAYKRPITVDSNNGNITYFVINYTSNMKTDFGDLRFVDSTETTELNYTIQSYVASTNATIRVQSLGASSFYMYYGNSAVNTTGNASRVYFDAVAYYYLDELTGTSTIDSIGGNNGTINGTTINQVGKINRAYNFDGTDDSVEIPDANNLDFNNVDFSVAIWFKYDSQADLEAILAKTPAYSTQQTNYGLVFAPANKLYFIVGSGATSDTLLSNTLTSGTWYHAVATFTASSGEMSLYVNGDRTNKTTAVNPASNAGSLWLGKYFSTGFYDGILDEVVIWNKVLTSDERNKLYTSTEATITVGTEEAQSTGNGTITVTLNSPINVYETNVSLITFNASIIPTTLTVNNVTLTINSTEYNVTEVSESSNFTAIWNNTFDDGVYTWFVTACSNSSTVTCATSSSRTFIVDTTDPFVNITSPANASTLLYRNFTLNWTAQDDNLDTCWIDSYDGAYRTTLQPSANSSLGKEGVMKLNYNGSYYTNSSIFNSSYLGNLSQCIDFGGEHYLYVNYSVPSDFVNNITWYLPSFAGMEGGIDNLTISTDYITDGKIMLRIYTYQTGGGIGFIYEHPAFYVYNTTSSSWDVIRSYASTNIEFCGEGIYWNALARIDNGEVSCNNNFTTLLYPTDNPTSMEVTLYANDSAGNTNSSSITLFKNIVPPSLTAYPSTYIVYNASQLFNITWSTDYGTSCWYNTSAGQNVNVSCALGAANLTYDGSLSSYQISFSTVDDFDNLNTTSFTINANTESPYLVMTEPVDAQVIINQTYTVNWLINSSLNYSACNVEYGLATSLANKSVTCTSLTTTLTFPVQDYQLVRMYANDTFGNMVMTDQVNITKSFDLPIVNITEPSGQLAGLFIEGDLVDLSYTLIPVNGSTLDTCWYSYAGSNQSINCYNDSTTFTPNYGTQTIQVCATDNLGNTGCDTNTWTYQAALIWNQTNYDSFTEGELMNFTALVYSNTGFTPNLVFDGVSKPVTVAVNGSFYNITYSVFAPTVSTPTNIDYLWRFTIGSDTYDTDTYTVLVSDISIDDCSTNSNLLLNFTGAYDESTLLRISNSTLVTFGVDIEIFSTDGTTKIAEYNYNTSNFNHHAICTDLSFSLNYVVKGIASYVGNQTYLSKRIWYLDNGTLPLNGRNLADHSPQNVTLFLLNPDASGEAPASFIFRYIDTNRETVGNAIIHVYRRNIGTGSVNEIGRTKSDGSTGGNYPLDLSQDSEVYRQYVTVDGEEVFDTSDYTVLTCSEFVSGYCIVELGGTKSIPPFDSDWHLIDGGSYSVRKDRATRQIILSYELADADALNSTTLSVYIPNYDGTFTLVTSDTKVGQTGEISLTVPMTTGGNYTYGTDYYMYYVSKGSNVISAGELNFERKAYEFFGDTFALFLAFLIILTLGMIAASGGPLQIIFVILGVVLSATLGLVKFGTTESGVGLLIYVIIAGGIVIWKMASR